MTKDMLLRQLGLLLSVSLALAIPSCRTSLPPKIENCVLDGFGGGDCVEVDESKMYRPPSKMTDYWCTNEPNMASFTSWCYDTSTEVTSRAMSQIKEKARK